MVDRACLRVLNARLVDGTVTQSLTFKRRVRLPRQVTEDVARPMESRCHDPLESMMARFLAGAADRYAFGRETRG